MAGLIQTVEGREKNRESEPIEHHCLRAGVYSPYWCYSPVCLCCGSEARNYMPSRNLRLVLWQIYKQSRHHLQLCILPDICVIDSNSLIDPKNERRDKKMSIIMEFWSFNALSDIKICMNYVSIWSSLIFSSQRVERACLFAYLVIGLLSPFIKSNSIISS